MAVKDVQKKTTFMMILLLGVYYFRQGKLVENTNQMIGKKK